MLLSKDRNMENIVFYLSENSSNTISSSLKVPIFNKKEEIFSSLCDYSIPMLRAAWFIKISSAYNTGVSESKGKKRIMADPASGRYKCIYYFYYSFTVC